MIAFWAAPFKWQTSGHVNDSNNLWGAGRIGTSFVDLRLTEALCMT